MPAHADLLDHRRRGRGQVHHQRQRPARCRFVAAPNFETPTDAGGNNVYDVTVQASDGTNTDTQAIAVTVTDVNDMPRSSPPMAAAPPRPSMSPRTPPRSPRSPPPMPMHGDADLLDHGGADASAFTINSTTGALTFVSAPDFETPTDAGGNDIYDVVVQVSDGTNIDSQAIAVTVTDQNEAPTITSGTAIPLLTRSTRTSPRSRPLSPSTRIRAGSTTFSIAGGADAAYSRSMPAPATLSFISAPDFENPDRRRRQQQL